MPTSFQNLIARLFWPRIDEPPAFLIESQDVLKLARPNYVQVNITARLQGQIPADQSAWLVEAIGETGDGRIFCHPKRPLIFAFPWQRYVSESYLSSGSPEIQRRPMVVIIPKSQEPKFWQRLTEGREAGNYVPQAWAQPKDTPIPAVGGIYTT